MQTHLWSNEEKRFCYVDAKATEKDKAEGVQEGRHFETIGGQLVEKDPVKFIGSCFPLLDETLPKAMQMKVKRQLEAEFINGFDHGIASVARDNPKRVEEKAGYEECYWRGPVWHNVEALLAPYSGRDAQIKDALLKKAAQPGYDFPEYTSQEDGRSLGGRQFGWTAAEVGKAAREQLRQLEVGAPRPLAAAAVASWHR